MKHTPGPWTLGAGYKIPRNHAVCSGPQIIAKVIGFGYPVGEGWDERSEANARLIAAAPELYKIAVMVVNAISEGQTFPGIDPDDPEAEIELWYEARQAIAKATGND
jgi:hypothetical protein